MRGKVTSLIPALPLHGITPAYAGKSPASGPVWRKRGDHPAYAGKRHLRRRSLPAWRDHPRVCGEKFRRSGFWPMKKGSPRVCGEKRLKLCIPVLGVGSPRVCGEKRDEEIGEGASLWITPAYAGKRLKRSHRIGHFSCILCLFHSVLHRASASGGSRAGPCAPPCLQPKCRTSCEQLKVGKPITFRRASGKRSIFRLVSIGFWFRVQAARRNSRSNCRLYPPEHLCLQIPEMLPAQRPRPSRLPVPTV